MFGSVAACLSVVSRSGLWEYIHYENTPIQYTVIFHSCKNDYFQMKNYDIFLIFAMY